MKQNQDKSIILMEGYDLRTVLSHPLDLKRLLKTKLSALNLESEPKRILRIQHSAPSTKNEKTN
jgi:hypothetical protein